MLSVIAVVMLSLPLKAQVIIPQRQTSETSELRGVWLTNIDSDVLFESDRLQKGYDPYTVALYKQEHRGKAPSKNPKDPEWVRWRADKITDFMKRVFFAIKANRKNCIVSVAPNPQRFSYEYYLADWQKWERMGLVEDLVLQIYRDDLNVFIQELEYPEVKAAKKHIPVSIGILTGLKNRSVPMQQIKTQVEKVRHTSGERGDRQFAGVSFFFYETLWNISQEKTLDRQAGFQELFPKPANYPNLLAGWKG